MHVLDEPVVPVVLRVVGDEEGGDVRDRHGPLGEDAAGEELELRVLLEREESLQGDVVEEGSLRGEGEIDSALECTSELVREAETVVHVLRLRELDVNGRRLLDVLAGEGKK